MNCSAWARGLDAGDLGQRVRRDGYHRKLPQADFRQDAAAGIVIRRLVWIRQVEANGQAADGVISVTPSASDVSPVESPMLAHNQHTFVP